MDNNNQLSKGDFVGSPSEGKDFGVQNISPNNLSQKPQETLRTIDAIANQDLVMPEGKKEIPLEMPPEEKVAEPKNESDEANLEIRGYGDNGKFGNENFKDMKKAIVAASDNPHSLNDAIQELSEEISGNVEKAT